MIKVNVEINNQPWHKKIKNPYKYFNKKLKKISKVVNFFEKKNITFTILLTNSLFMKKLNKKFRKKNKSTDVLSFPFHKKNQLNNKIKREKEIYLGDIIINLSKIKNKNNRIKFEKELNKLWIHGLVHLFGHKHKKDQDFYTMNKIEKKYLGYIN